MTSDQKCQWAADPEPCGMSGTHALVVDGVDSQVRMCGPHARDAVITFIAQGEKGVHTVAVDADRKED